ncbi:aminoglycoside phosphotransferase family protein [Kitasatospora sp. NPDC051170]|uniref:aminoglycoside phosphotransferase family protein n=1 Tax=Kitasatospora sp. NPDC051170 TaxID=3364056 RepID=UPI00379FDF36
MTAVEIPPALAVSLEENLGPGGLAWVRGLPALARESLERWELRPDGPAAHGVVALVLPVRRADGSRAALKLQPVDEETQGEPLALRTWHGRGAVRLLDHEPATGAMLLERLDATRTLLDVPEEEALRAIAELLSELTRHQAPPGMRQLGEITHDLLLDAPGIHGRLADPDERRLIAACARALTEVRTRPGDRLLHWDLHYGNVLAPLPDGDGRAPWLAIDPKPLAGHPGFELLPALTNRWDDLRATGDTARALRRRFDLLTEALDLDRAEATAWTLGRVLQNTRWSVVDGGRTALDPAPRLIAEVLLGRGPTFPAGA